MTIGISTATFFVKSKTEDSFDLIRECNLQTCEVFLTTFTEYERDFGKILLEKKGDIEVHSIHTLNSQFEPELYNEVERTRNDAEKVFRNALAIGQMLGAKYYTFHGPARLRRNVEYVFDYDKLSRRTNELMDICGEYGITLSYENVHWAYYYEGGFFTELKKRFCPRLKGTLDIKQAKQSRVSYMDFIKDMGRDISTIHLCDYDENGRTRGIGKGIFDFKEFFKVLRNEGIDAPIMIELYNGDFDCIDEIKSCVQYLQSI